MVKKYFRRFICAVCATMSVICSVTPMFASYVSAESVDVVDEGEEENDTGGEDPSDDEVTEDNDVVEDDSSDDVPSGNDQDSTGENTSAETPETPSGTANQPENTAPGSDGNEQQNQNTGTGSETTPGDGSEAGGTGNPGNEAGGTDNPGSDSGEAETPDTKDEEDTKHDAANSIDLSMSQSADAVTPVDEIRQTVTAAYKDEVDSQITYTVDPSLDVKNIEIGANTYLEGGKAVIHSASGETEMNITSTMDLSGYENVSKIVFTPKIKSYSGMEAKFTAVMKLKEKAVNAGVTSVTCKTEVTATAGDTKADFSKELETKISSASVSTPSLSLTYDGKEYGDTESISGVIEFDKEFALNLSGFGMEAYGQTEKYVYSVTVPSFVTLKEIQLPAVTVDSVKVITKINDADTELGDFAPGETVSVGKAGVSEVRFEIIPGENSFSAAASGKLVFQNNVKDNKGTNNASFAAYVNAKIGDNDYSSNSSILSVNVKSRKITEPETKAPQTNANNGGGNGGGNSGSGSNGGSAPSQTEPQTEPETENPNDEARKKEEAERKEKVKKEAIQNEQELKNKQNSILAARLSKLQAQSGSTGSTSTATSTKKKTVTETEKKYSGWKVKPIEDSIVSDLVPKDIDPIPESIIENLIPGVTGTNETPETTEWVNVPEMPQTIAEE